MLFEVMRHIQFSLEEWEDEFLFSMMMLVEGVDARNAVPRKSADIIRLDERRVSPDGIETPDEDVVDERHVSGEEALNIAVQGLGEGNGGKSGYQCPGVCVGRHLSDSSRTLVEEREEGG